jgi:hypothetical protein
MLTFEGGDAVTAERVVWFHDWTTLPAGRRLGAVPRTDAGWGIAPDAALKDRAAVLLYFDIASYDHAVRALPPEEVERAVLRRREVFRLASNDARRVLEGLHSAMAHAAKTGATETYERLLAIAVDLWAGGRFDSVDTKTLLTIAIDADARALGEARDLPLGQDATELERRYGLDADIMAALGRPEFARSPLHVPCQRLCRVSPDDPAMHYLFHEGNRIVGPDWIVGPLLPNAIDVLRTESKRVEVLAFELAPLSAWLLETPIQAQRDILAAVDGMAADEAGEAKVYGRELRFRQHAIRVQMAARLAGDASARAADAESDVENERSHLADVYARAPDRATPSLDAAVDQAQADADFLATRSELSLASRRRWERVAAALASAHGG